MKSSIYALNRLSVAIFILLMWGIFVEKRPISDSNIITDFWIICVNSQVIAALIYWEHLREWKKGKSKESEEDRNF